MAHCWYGHFDSTEEDERLLLAEDWAKYIRSFLGDGIRNGGTNLQVTSDSNGMYTLIDEGYANIQGYILKIEADYDGIRYRLDHPSAHPTQTRIDRIILRLDRTIAQRNILPEVLIGAPGANEPPALTRNANIWELSLAQVRVPPGAYTVLPTYLTDERLDNTVCGIIDSMISADTEAMYKNFTDAFHWTIADVNRQFDEAFTELYEGQTEKFFEVFDMIRDIYGDIHTDITKLQSFSFDNLFELPGTTRSTVFNEDGTINELIAKNSNGEKVAERFTEFQDNGDIVITTSLYDKDGETLLKKSATTIRFETDGIIREVTR